MACAFSHVCSVAEMVGPAKLRDDLTDSPISLEGGQLSLPEGNGIGIDLSEEKLAQYTVGGEITVPAS